MPTLLVFTLLNICSQVIDYLVNRHNTFLAKVPGVKPPTIPTQYVTDATLVPDVTESFLAVVSRNHLTPEESVGGNQFRLNRIAHDVCDTSSFLHTVITTFGFCADVDVGVQA